MPDDTIGAVELKDWLDAFRADPSLAFYKIPNRVYAFLRNQGLLDAEHDLTPEAVQLLGG